MGLPTPNIFTGGQNYHSLREWASVQDMAAAAATIVELVRVSGRARMLGGSVSQHPRGVLQRRGGDPRGRPRGRA